MQDLPYIAPSNRIAAASREPRVSRHDPDNRRTPETEELRALFSQAIDAIRDLTRKLDDTRVGQGTGDPERANAGDHRHNDSGHGHDNPHAPQGEGQRALFSQAIDAIRDLTRKLDSLRLGPVSRDDENRTVSDRRHSDEQAQLRHMAAELARLNEELSAFSRSLAQASKELDQFHCEKGTPTDPVAECKYALHHLQKCCDQLTEHEKPHHEPEREKPPKVERKHRTWIEILYDAIVYFPRKLVRALGS